VTPIRTYSGSIRVVGEGRQRGEDELNVEKGRVTDMAELWECV
jgi:hypothetical protein